MKYKLNDKVWLMPNKIAGKIVAIQTSSLHPDEAVYGVQGEDEKERTTTVYVTEKVIKRRKNVKKNKS